MKFLFQFFGVTVFTGFCQSSVLYLWGMQNVLLFLQQHQGIEFYSLLTLSLVASGCYFPISSDLVIITITALSAATGLYNISAVFFCILAGMLMGDMINFTVAKKYGPQILKNSFMQKILTPEKVDHTTQRLKRVGEKYILLVRFMPLVRTILYFCAGLIQVPTWKFILYNGISTCVFLSILMTLSYNVGANIEKLNTSVLKFELLFAAVALTVIFLMIYLKRRKRITK